ncbi:hypothetical protein Bca4012_062358 [Brassica carinata]
MTNPHRSNIPAKPVSPPPKLFPATLCRRNQTARRFLHSDSSAKAGVSSARTVFGDPMTKKPNSKAVLHSDSSAKTMSHLIIGTSAVFSLRFLLEDHFLKGRTEYLNTKLYACDPLTLPKYPSNNDMDAKYREEKKTSTKFFIRNWVETSFCAPVYLDTLLETCLATTLSEFPYIGLSQTTAPANGFTWAGIKKRNDNDAASTLTYNQPGSMRISFAKTIFGLTIHENQPSFIKQQVSPDSSDMFMYPGATRNQKKIHWVH